MGAHALNDERHEPKSVTGIVSEGIMPFGAFSENQLLNYQEASKYLSISVSKLKKMKQDREVPFVMIGDSPRFRIASLNRWIQRREVS